MADDGGFVVCGGCNATCANNTEALNEKDWYWKRTPGTDPETDGGQWFCPKDTPPEVRSERRAEWT